MFFKQTIKRFRKNKFNKDNADKTVAQVALELLSSVPADDFILDRFTNESNKCCAIGHYQRLTSGDPKDYSFENCVDRNRGGGFRKMTAKFISNVHHIEKTDVSNVNDENSVNGYNEPIIKDRVIHLLNDMVKAGY